MIPPYLRIIFSLGALLLPHVALAHSPIKGIGHLLNGTLHPLLVPAQILLILSLGLWFGQHQPEKKKTTILLFLMSTVIGLLIAGTHPIQNENTLSLFILSNTLLLGLLLVTRYRVPQSLFLLLSISSGLLLGLDSTPESLIMKAKIATLFGSGIGIYFLVLYAMALSESFSVRPWQILAVRIFSSWLTASTLMVLAFHFSGKY